MARMVQPDDVCECGHVWNNHKREAYVAMGELECTYRCPRSDGTFKLKGRYTVAEGAAIVHALELAALNYADARRRTENLEAVRARRQLVGGQLGTVIQAVATARGEHLAAFTTLVEASHKHADWARAMKEGE